MKTTDLFKVDRSAKKINESMEKMFGTKLDLASFDLPRLEDARNKIRTQLSQVRSNSSFNENIENEAVTQAQFMLDAINAEIAERQEFIADPHVAEVEEAMNPEVEEFLQQVANSGNDAYDMIYDGMTRNDAVGAYLQDMASDISREHRYHPDDDIESIIEVMVDQISDDYGQEDNEGGETDDNYAMASAGFGSDEDYESVGFESAPPTAKGERMVKHIKKGYAKDGKLTDKEKSIAYATAWKQHNKEKNESVETGDNMTRLTEGEVQQASAIVTAKTMVDRVSRWIEELSGMENDTLLQLGDSIRDEMSAEQAKQFISSCAPAIQQALQNLKDTRETLSTGVRMLTGEEQGAEMLGGDEMGAGDEMGPAEPDMMNTGDEGDLGDLGAAPEDEFGAADAAVGGIETAGREQRESIDRSNSLLRVLAG